MSPSPSPKRSKKPKAKKTPPRRQPRYHVILWNDDDHSYDYVVEMMQKLFGHPREKGFQIAKEVDKQGKADLPDDRPGARRAETRPNQSLRPRQTHRPLQRLDERHDGGGELGNMPDEPADVAQRNVRRSMGYMRLPLEVGPLVVRG